MNIFSAKPIGGIRIRPLYSFDGDCNAALVFFKTDTQDLILTVWDFFSFYYKRTEDWETHDDLVGAVENYAKSYDCLNDLFEMFDVETLTLNRVQERGGDVYYEITAKDQWTITCGHAVSAVVGVPA